MDGRRVYPACKKCFARSPLSRRLAAAAGIHGHPSISFHLVDRRSRLLSALAETAMLIYYRLFLSSINVAEIHHADSVSGAIEQVHDAPPSTIGLETVNATS